MKSLFGCLLILVAIAACICCVPAFAGDSVPGVNSATSVLPQGVIAITRETTHVVRSQAVAVTNVGCQCGCGKEVCDCTACAVKATVTAKPKRERITVYYTPGPGNRKVAKGTALQLKHSGSN